MRRGLTIGGALVLAAVGAFLLISYVRGAERRALEGQTMVQVLVVTKPIDKGATVDDIRGSVELRDVPLDTAAEGAIATLDDLTGRIAAVDLVPGEEVLTSRFETPQEAAVDTRVEVPPDLLQATLVLSPEQAVGGRLVAGDLVAVVASFEPFELGTVEPTDPAVLQAALDSLIVAPGTDSTTTPTAAPITLKTPYTTHILIHKVLVTGIQLQQAPKEATDGTATVQLAPTGKLLVTIAAAAEDMEKVLFTAEYGSLWLALEQVDAPEPTTEIRTRTNVYRR